MALTTKKIAIIIGGAILIVAISLAIALPLTVFKKKNDDEIFLKGSDVLDVVPLIDGHNDFPMNLYELEKNILKNFDFDSDLKVNSRWNKIPNSSTDLPRLRSGKLGGQFWVAYVGCDTNYKDAVERTMEQIDVIKRLVKRYPKDLMYVTEADQIMEAFKAGKIASMIEVEGGHSIDSRLSVLRLFYELGVRCMTITHNCNTPWADNNQIDGNLNAPKKNLTEWGRKVIAEINRLGIIADISHVSEGVMVDVLQSSKAPVIFSHSSVFSIRNHTRNVKDHVLLKLKENNGVIMINFYSHFIAFGNSTIFDVVKHINYVKELIGVDHVGIGSDFDGIESVPEGLEDVSKYPALFDLLAEEGHEWEPWTAEELKKLAGLNLIRVFKKVEAVRDSLKGTVIIDDPIPYEDVITDNENARGCRTDLDKYKPKIINTLLQDNKNPLVIAGWLILFDLLLFAKALPLTVYKQKSNIEEIFKGSSVLDEVPLIDSHNDLPNNLYKLENNQMGEFDLDTNLKTNQKWQVNSSYTDLPRLRSGKVGGQFWVAYVSCDTNYKDAIERTLEQIDIIKRIINRYPKDLMYVTEADQIMEAFKARKIASMIEVEGGHSIDSRLSILRLFYELGVRCMTITHNCNTPWADNNLVDLDPNLKKKNLTEWGKKVIAEMNRLGMIVDLSHVSEGVMIDAIQSSKAPVIFSHSSVFSIKNHTRNVKDHVLLKLRENNGVLMINFYSNFIGQENSTIFDVVRHINYVKDLIGVDHVGIGADYDGVSLMPEGLEDVSKYPALFDLLAEKGHDWEPWTAEELKKLAGLNLIRVFKQVESVRDSLENTEIIDDPIPYEDITTENEISKECRTDMEKYESFILKQLKEEKVLNLI